jgi:hypothetical protein
VAQHSADVGPRTLTHSTAVEVCPGGKAYNLFVPANSGMAGAQDRLAAIELQITAQRTHL